MTLALASIPPAPHSFGIVVRGRFAPSVIQLDEQNKLICLHKYNPLLDVLGVAERPRGFPQYRGVLFHSLTQAKAALIDCLTEE